MRGEFGGGGEAVFFILIYLHRRGRLEVYICKI